MKKLNFFFPGLLFLPLVFFVLTLNAQVLLYEENFESHTCSVAAGNDNCNFPGVEWFYESLGVIDDDNCLPNWSTSHGTPSLSGFNLFQGNYNLRLEYGVINSKLAGDGVFLDTVNFEKDSCYLISFWYDYNTLYPLSIGEDLIDCILEVGLANDLIYDDPYYPEPCFENESALISYQKIFSKHALEMYEYAPYKLAQYVVTADDDYEQLWFFINTSINANGDVPGYISIDSLTIERIDCDFPCACENGGTQIGQKGVETSIDTDTDFNGTISTGCYEIAGTLLIDESTVATDATFIMQPGSEIVVEDGFSLKVSGSTFESCIHMWKGITVEDGGILNSINNVFNDAQYAINLLNGSSFGLEGSLFDKNYVGVYAQHKGNVCGQVSQISPFDNNEFKCSGLLLTPYDGQTPDPGIESYSGVLARNICHLNIGISDNSTIVNEFHDMRNGIVSVRSNIGIYYCKITDINGFDQVYTPPLYQEMSGLGVFLIDCPKSKVNRNTISDINVGNHGIWSIGSNARIQHNTISDMLMGIRCEDFSGNISSNDLDGNRGIWVYESHNKNIAITDNEIDVESISAVHHGIHINDCENMEGGDFTIEGNTIETNGFWSSAIFLEDNAYWKLDDNTITHNSPVGGTWSPAGIQLDNNEYLQIRNNNITGNGTSITYNGIESYNNGGLIYCCNTIDETKIGLHIIGAGKARIATTQFKDHDRGLVYHASGNTGNQGNESFSYGNYWHEDNTDVEAEHEGPGAAFLSRYFVLSSEGADEIEPTSGWFTYISEPANTCTNWSDCGVTEWLIPEISEFDTIVVNDGLDSLAFNEVVTWTAKQDLYKKLVDNPSLYSSNQMMEDFKDSTATSEIGRLYEVESAFMEAIIPSDSLAGIISKLRDTITLHTNELDSLNSILVTALPLDSSRILLEKDTILGYLYSVTNNYLEEIDSFRVSRHSALKTVESINDTITVSSDMAINEQEVNEIELHYWLNDFVADTSDIADLFEIAKQCPLIGGNAVFRARSLHDIMTFDLILWDSLAACDTLSGFRIKKTEEEQIQGLLVYPNPTNGAFTVEILQKIAEPVSIGLFDLNGRQVKEFLFENDPIEINGNYLPQGVYTIRVELDNGNVLSDRIIIVH